MMKQIIYRMAVLGMAFCTTACFDAEDENFRTLEPISFNEVSATIDVSLGEELVYDKLQVESELPVTYEWAYGKPKASSKDEYAMESIEVISDKADIRHTFNRVGTYLLRLKVDNGESIVYKYFTLNVNSGLDEGILILSNDAEGDGALTFIKKRTEDEIAANEQEIYPDIFASINPDNPLKKGTAMYISDYTSKEIQYTSLLVATADENGTIYKLNPKTLELYAVNRLGETYGASCVEFAGEAASSAAYYVLMRGDNGHTYRYDLFADITGERPDATAAGLVTHATTLVYRTSATAKPSRKPLLYNATTLFQPGSGKVTSRSLAGYDIVNLCSASLKNLTYVLFRSQTDPKSYCIKSTTGTLAAFKDVTTFTADAVNMDENSIMVNSKNSSDVYYSYDNKIYRWSLTSAPPATSKLLLPDGEIIRSMATNFMGTFGDDTQETLLYVATYNPERKGEKKGSLYIFRFSDDTLVKQYEGICDDPVQVMYKYRIS